MIHTRRRGPRAAARVAMFITTPISIVYDELVIALVRLEQAWTCEREVAGLRFAAADMRHHVCMAMACLGDEPPDFEGLAPDVSVHAHEAFLAVIAVGQLLLRAIEEQYADASAIAQAQVAVDKVLDRFTLFVSRADIALRRVLLEGATIEESLEGIGDA
jgi:hypothetical protein